jgi:AcrR family transcriptional regulator
VELTLEKGYGAVTVQDVLERADVARATFYAHFRDKDDLLVSGFEEVREHLRAYVMGHGGHPGYGATEGGTEDEAKDAVAAGGGLRWLFEHVGSNRALWQALAGRRGGGAAAMVVRRARGEIEGLLREHLEEALARHGGGAVVTAEVMVSYVVSALVGLLTWWLDDDAAFAKYSAVQLHAHFMRLTEPAVMAALGKAEHSGHDLDGGLPRD